MEYSGRINSQLAAKKGRERPVCLEADFTSIGSFFMTYGVRIAMLSREDGSGITPADFLQGQ